MQIIEKYHIIYNLLSEKSSFSFHSTIDCAKSHFEKLCNIQKLYLIMQSAAFYLQGHAETQTIANYVSYNLEQFSTHCTLKAL